MRNAVHSIGASLAIVAATAVFGAAAIGCEEGPPPNVPPQPSGTPTSTAPYAVPAMPGQPGADAVTPQVTAPPAPAPAGGSQMNAQAMALYGQGVAAFGNADLRGAEVAFRQAATADPTAYRAHYSRGAVLERLGRPSEALSSYQRAFEVVPEYTDAMVAYATLQASEGAVSDADAFLTERRGRLPKSAALASALAEVKSLAKDSASAQQIAQEALKLDPSHAPAMMAIARDHWRARRLDLALYALKAILDGFGDANPARDRNNADAHLLRAVILLEQDKRVGAVEAYRRAMELRPDLVLPRVRVATYLLETGGAVEAVPILEGALRYDAENLAAHLCMGDAQRLLGNYAKAKEEFEWVKLKDGNLAPVYYNFGLLYLFAPSLDGLTPTQQVEAAIAELTRFKELRSKTDPTDVDELLSRANLKKAELVALAAANAAPAEPPPEPTGEPGAGTDEPPAAPPAPAPTGEPGAGEEHPQPADGGDGDGG